MSSREFDCLVGWTPTSKKYMKEKILLIRSSDPGRNSFQAFLQSIYISEHKQDNKKLAELPGTPVFVKKATSYGIDGKNIDLFLIRRRKFPSATSSVETNIRR